MKKPARLQRLILGALIPLFILGLGAQSRPQSSVVTLPSTVNISHSSSNSDTPLIGVDGNGAAYVVWYEHLTPRQFYFATNKSGSWSTPLWLDRLYYDVEEAGWPEFAVSPSGSAHLSYQDGKDVSLSYDIMGKSLSGGTWGPTVFVSNNTSASCYSGCAFNPVDDSLFVVWQDSNGNPGVGEWNILLRYRTAAGVWSANQTLPVGWGYMPKIVVDGTGTAHMVWGNSHGRTLWYSHNRTPQSAGGWTTPIQIKYDCGLEWSMPQIACDLAGNVAFVWMDGANGYEQISCLRLNQNGSYYPEINVSQSAVPATDGAVALNPLNGDVLTAWTQGGDIYANACLGGTWTGPYNVTRGSGTAGMPRVAVDVTGRAHLVYAQAISGGATDIMYLSIAAPIQVIAPNGGEAWNVGSSQTIRWTTPYPIAAVRIELSTDSGTNYQTVAAGASNTGSYTWTVPNTPSIHALIRISDASNAAVNDVSDADFSIVAGAAIAVTSPNGGENWAAGSSRNITWTSSGVSNVKIEYSTNGGSSYTSVIASTSNTGSYAWTVPNAPSTNCLVRVSDASNAAVNDVSNATFTISAAFRKDDFLGTWAGQGVYYRNSDTGTWVPLASPATKVTAGDLDGDGIDDVIGIWPSQGGVWVKYSTSGTWAILASTADGIVAADMNGDGQAELLGSWAGQGVYWRNNATGVWTQLATPATKITAGDLDGDGIDDLIGIWPSQGGVWVKYSKSGAWALLSSTADWIAVGDMNGDGRAELLGSWAGQGVFWRNNATGEWTQLATAANQIAAGDLDGDGTDDLIGTWPAQSGVWVKYSQSGTWANLSSTADWIATGKMRATNSQGLGHVEELALPMGGFVVSPPKMGAYENLSANSPGREGFTPIIEKNLIPIETRQAKIIPTRIPGPGEPGFRCIQQKDLFPEAKLPEEKSRKKSGLDK